jgi:hypothetical protein
MVEVTDALEEVADLLFIGQIDRVALRPLGQVCDSMSNPLLSRSMPRRLQPLLALLLPLSPNQFLLSLREEQFVCHLSSCHSPFG